MDRATVGQDVRGLKCQLLNQGAAADAQVHHHLAAALAGDVLNLRLGTFGVNEPGSTPHVKRVYHAASRERIALRCRRALLM